MFKPQEREKSLNSCHQTIIWILWKKYGKERKYYIIFLSRMQTYGETLHLGNVIIIQG